MQRITRRRMLVGGGVGLGLVVGWTAWPRRARDGWIDRSGAVALGSFLRIGDDGRITIIVPQIETGQGIWTALAQVLGDELGADWRTVAVEPAPPGSAYANLLLADELAEGWPGPVEPIAERLAERRARDAGLAVTALSTSLRAFEQPMRDAGATARALLCMAAAARWEIDWRACDTDAGFVVRGDDRLRFADLAADAVRFKPPEEPPLRLIGAGGLSGREQPRLDAPAKLDGSLRFAGDVRLPGMVFASVRRAPPGDSRLVRFDAVAARAVPDLVAIVDTPGWIAAVGDNWWAANRALDALHPRFETRGERPDGASIDRALTAALAGPGDRIAAHGHPDVPLGADAVTAEYAAGLAAHAAIETPAACARRTGDRLEIWAATQAPAAARAAAARAAGLARERVTLYPMPLGGGFGAGLDHEVVAIAAVLAGRLGRPVQLMMSRVEECVHDRFRPPARARLAARLAPGGGIAAWRAAIATPSAARDTFARIAPELPRAPGGDALAVAGAAPPYAVGALAVTHHATIVGLPLGVLRGEAHGVTAFFTETFIDELAGKAGQDGLSFRMALLGDNPRLAACLATVAELGGWRGGSAGTGQGLAAHAAYDSHVAVLAEARVDGDGRIAVDRLTCVVDCGRVVNPDLVRQQIAGGLLFALPAAIGPAIKVVAGLPEPRRLRDLGLPLLHETPGLLLRILPSHADPGGVSGLAVAPVAAAIGNAIFAATGHRSRTLPLSLTT